MSFLLEKLMKLLSAKRCIFKITIFLVFIAFVATILFDNLRSAFVYNIQINSVILISFFVGVTLIYRRIFLYDQEYGKLLTFDKLKKTDLEQLKLLSPISFYISRSSNVASQAKLDSVMESVEKRVDDCGAFPKYISGILIFLGLFGTFWGLSQTIGNVANIIDNLGIDQTDAAESFVKLKDSLRIPLSGMGIAFGCSLFGLSGSLILGFLNMNQKRVADNFLYKVEEWITKRTVSLDTAENESTYHGQVFSMGLLEKTIEMIYAFQNQLKDFEGNRLSLLEAQRDLSMKISQLTDAVAMHQDLVKAIGSGQVDMQNMTKKLNDSVWNEILNKLDGIDRSMSNLVQGTFSNRDYIVDNLGKDIRMISKTLSSLMRE